MKNRDYEQPQDTGNGRHARDGAAGGALAGHGGNASRVVKGVPIGRIRRQHRSASARASRGPVVTAPAEAEDTSAAYLASTPPV